MPRCIYTLLLYILLPFTPLKLLWRGIRQPEYLQHIGERYGFYPKPHSNEYFVVEPGRTNRTVGGSPPRLHSNATLEQQVRKPLIWLHCVSVGETHAAEPLVKVLQSSYPQHRILLTHTTPTGRQASEQLFGDSVMRVYLPYDVPGAVKRFLRHFQPQIGLLMETELWFNLIAECAQRHIPLLLVNARLSPRSAKGYAKAGGLTRQGLRALTFIAAQTDADAERLKSLGARNIIVTGNLKFDVKPPADAAGRGAQLRELLGKKRPVFLAASTRDGEEHLILQAVAASKILQLLTIIVPRHPQRFDEVASLLRKEGIAFCRRSEFSLGTVAGEIAKSHVILGDSMGEMFTYYAACDVAFIGGSLLPFGGQNLIEACAMGKPALVGPHTYNFESAVEQAIAHDAAWRVKDAAEIAACLQQLFDNPEKIEAMSKAALEFSDSAGGATQKVAEMVERYLPK